MVGWHLGLGCAAVFSCACACGVTQGDPIQRQQQAIIYGEDDRVELEQYEGQPARGLVQRVVAALVPRRLVTLDAGGAVRIDGPTLGDRTGLCPGETLREQMSAAVCSAVLVGERYFVTAGHCFRSEQAEELVLVLGYVQGETFGRFESATVREIEGFVAIVDGSIASDSGNDYAIGVLTGGSSGGIELSGTVSEELMAGAGVVVVGTGEGLPLKVDTGGEVFDATPADYFEVTTDTFAGGSGSPVFTEAGAFLGLVVGGGADYQWDETQACLARTRLGAPSERAEIVVRTETIQRALADLPDGGRLVPYIHGEASEFDAGFARDAGSAPLGSVSDAKAGDDPSPVPREAGCAVEPNPSAHSAFVLILAWLCAVLLRARRVAALPSRYSKVERVEGFVGAAQP